MPNYIQNRLKVIGNPELVKKVLDALKSTNENGDVREVDFNQIIPMPPIMRGFSPYGPVVTAVKKLYDVPLPSNPLLAMLETYNRKKIPVKFEQPEMQEMFEMACKIYNETGYVYWYDWAIEHWGTKWNAMEVGDLRDTEDTVHFETAWNSPVTLFVLFSTKFPEASFELTYADEDASCNTGHFTFKAGKVSKSTRPKCNSKEGYDLFFELHPDAKEDYKLVDGQYKHIEDD